MFPLDATSSSSGGTPGLIVSRSHGQWFLTLTKPVYFPLQTSPVFPVVHSKKQKIRLVFDASAEYSGVSLNSVLLKGPDFNNDLRGVLIRFREGLIGFVADINKMFNNFKVPEEQRNYLRFYWYSNNSPRNKLVQYRSKSHIFGCTSSPAVANFCLRFVAKDLAADNLAKNYIENAFYVDDGLSSANSASEAVETLQQAIAALGKYNVRLHKVNSSSREVLQAFPESERSSSTHNFRYEEIPSQRTLGILWKPEKDVFAFEVSIPERKFTKRGVISVINSLYDPLGFVAPIVLTARLIQRTILPPKKNADPELEQYGWDDPLPGKFLEKWENWKQSLESLSSLEIPRCYIPNDEFISSSKELHVFCDASEEAIGFVIYVKSVDKSGNVHLAIVTGGAKVAPKSATTIPRLELCAALEATIVCNNVIKELSYDLSSVTYYSDSRVTLGYLHNTKRQFSNYVTRRVKMILSMTRKHQWRYVSTNVNPADISSRPQTPNELKRSS